MTESLHQTLDLVRAAQEGDPSALDRLLDHHQSAILLVIRARMGPRLRQRYESQDILQETLMAAFRSFDRFEVRTDAQFKNWVARIAENRLLALQKHESYEKRAVDKERSLDAPLPDQSRPMADHRPSDTRSPLEKAAASERSAKLQETLQRLPENYRELILLRNLLRMEWQEIADELGRPSAAAARVMYTTAARRFKELGGDLDPEAEEKDG